ncbi:MAG TPA: TMEM175 family protein [Candidatus Limnocylindrales bacterium]|jgi:TMEM175 potassium channel family protein|nr:TMEM175 family protein [Candidatus Limnocylindrales bacterium]
MIRFDSVTNRYHDGIRWFRSIATTSPADDPTGSGSGFGTERDPRRLVLFSDAVFAIAVTLLVLEIRPPQDTRHLLHGLAALWPSYLAYAITFLLIGQVWANHHVMFDHIRSVDRTVLFLNTLLLMDIAFLPFAAAVLSAAFRTGHGQRTAVVFYGIVFEVAALLFNVIWEYARRGHRLLGRTIDAVGSRAIGRRFRLALAWIAAGTLLGVLLPVLGLAVIAAFIPYYWLPIPGEIARAKPRHHGRGHA